MAVYGSLNMGSHVKTLKTTNATWQVRLQAYKPLLSLGLGPLKEQSLLARLEQGLRLVGQTQRGHPQIRLDLQNR